jgi:hypothetical protein
MSTTKRSNVSPSLAIGMSHTWTSRGKEKTGTVVAKIAAHTGISEYLTAQGIIHKPTDVKESEWSSNDRWLIEVEQPGKESLWYALNCTVTGLT